MRRDVKQLTKKRDELVKIMKDLEENKTNLDLEEYENEKRKIERQLVEICDRLVQYRYVSKGGI